MYTENTNEYTNKKAKKSILLTSAMSTILLFAVCAFLIKPVYISMNSNVLYNNTALMPIFQTVILVLENLAYAICFASAIYSIFRFSLKGALPTLFISASTLLFKSLCNLLTYFITIGYFDLGDMLIYLRDFSIDLIKLVCVVLLSLFFIKRFHKRQADASQGTELVYDELFSKKIVPSRRNPLSLSAIVSALIILSTELIAETSYYIAYGFFITMIFDYITDILIALMIYTVSLYIFSHFHAKEQRVSINR